MYKASKQVYDSYMHEKQVLHAFTRSLRHAPMGIYKPHQHVNFNITQQLPLYERIILRYYFDMLF